MWACSRWEVLDAPCPVPRPDQINSDIKKEGREWICVQIDEGVLSEFDVCVDE